MRWRTRSHQSGGPIHDEADLSRSLAELDLAMPDWEEPARMDAVLRRLHRDSSVLGVRVAVEIFGQAPVALGLARLEAERSAQGLQPTPVAVEPKRRHEVTRADANIPQDAASRAHSKADKHDERKRSFAGADLTYLEFVVLAGLVAGRSMSELAQELGTSQTRILRTRQVLRMKLSEADQHAKQSNVKRAPSWAEQEE